MGKDNGKVRWVKWVLISILITLGLEMVGAAMHTVISATFHKVPVNYVWKRWELFSPLHVMLRGFVAAVAFWWLKMVADDNKFQLKYAVLVVVGCAILLLVVDFATYVAEYFTLAMWKAATSVGETVTLKNVIRCEFLEAVDLVSRLCQGLVALLTWWVRTKKRERKSQVIKLATAKKTLVAENERLQNLLKDQSEKIETLTSELNKKRGEKTIMLPSPRE